MVLDVYRGKATYSIGHIQPNGRAEVSFSVSGKVDSFSAREIETIAGEIYDQLREVRDPLARKQLDKPPGPYLVPKGVDPDAYHAQMQLVMRRNEMFEARQQQQYGKAAFEKELQGPMQDVPVKAK